jgi:phosphinothricin acetyltransferase
VSVAKRREWLSQHNPDTHPILVAEIDGVVVGWSSLSEYRPGRLALRRTAELSYYVHFDHHGQGIGSALIRASIDRCPKLRFRNLFAILLEDNTASIGLLEKFGFKRWGFMPKVAEFSDREVGHLYYGLRISSVLKKR